METEEGQQQGVGGWLVREGLWSRMPGLCLGTGSGAVVFAEIECSCQE